MSTTAGFYWVTISGKKIATSTAEDQEALQEIAERGHSSIEQGWVACSERLPEVSMKPLLIYGSKVNGDKMPIKIAYWNGYWRQWISNVQIKRNVTHWMPLPAAPPSVDGQKNI